MLIISLKNVYKSFGINSVLNDISFNVNEGDKIGLIGQNGGGKSTLLKILANQIEATSGEIFINKSKTLGYLTQNSKFDEDLTIYENALLSFENLIKIEKRIEELSKILETNQNKDIIEEYTNLSNKFKIFLV